MESATTGPSATATTAGSGGGSAESQPDTSRADTGARARVEAPAPPAGARQLCNEHINGGTMHIEWRSYATTTSVAEVAEHYRRKTPGATEGREPAGDSPADVTSFSYSEDLNVSIYRVGSKQTYPGCSVKPNAAERTVIVQSLAIRR